MKLYKFVLYAHKRSSNSYIKYLRRKGINVGSQVTFHEPNTNYIDIQKPWMITIGNNVEITRGVIILTHDYSWSVIKGMTGEIIGCRGKVVIGNNVFVGMNTIIMPGVTIGSNVIIGANSVVVSDVESESVIAGSPAKWISTTEDYYQKRKKEYLNDAKKLFIEYWQKKGEIPPKDVFDEFFWLFEERSLDRLPKPFTDKLNLGVIDYERERVQKNVFLNSTPEFEGYSKFVEWCMKGAQQAIKESSL